MFIICHFTCYLLQDSCSRYVKYEAMANTKLNISYTVLYYHEANFFAEFIASRNFCNGWSSIDK